MDTSCINVKILEADGTCQREKGFINPPKAATEILNRLQAGGRVGTLRNSRGRSLSGSDLLNDSQQYNLELAPSGHLLTACLSAFFCSLKGLLLTYSIAEARALEHSVDDSLRYLLNEHMLLLQKPQVCVL